MFSFFQDLFQTLNWFPEITDWLIWSILFTIFVFSGVAVGLVVNLVLLRILKSIIKKTSFHWDDILFDKAWFSALGTLIPFFVMHTTRNLFFEESSEFLIVITKILSIVVAVLFARLFMIFIDNIQSLLLVSKLPKGAPVKSYAQVAKILVMIFSGIVILSIFIEQDPLVILSGIGALTAVLLLVFKDSLLGFVASIQINAEDMVKIGDWIEIPSHGGDGEVIDISLAVVKIRNWDHTITHAPTYSLVSGSFKNWRGMSERGGRRVKRSLIIDSFSVGFLEQDRLESLKRFGLLKGYLDEKIAEIEDDRKVRGLDSQDRKNARNLTNLGTFRAYIHIYLRQHPGVHQEMILLVRQLDLKGRGVPLELYFFTNTVAWIPYENIQSDIFDHLLSIMPEFGLKPFQEPSGLVIPTHRL